MLTEWGKNKLLNFYFTGTSSMLNRKISNTQHSLTPSDFSNKQKWEQFSTHQVTFRKHVMGNVLIQRFLKVPSKLFISKQQLVQFKFPMTLIAKQKAFFFTERRK